MLRDMKREYPDVDYFDENDLIEAMQDVYEETRRPFVVIIDEWDCIFREYKEDKEAQEIYLDFLRDMLKDKPCIHLAYMTGILPIKKYGTHSALNMFDEFSMIDPGPMAEYVGFTEEEVFTALDNMGMSEQKEIVKSWYDGFVFGNQKDIYNPWSITNYLDKKQVRTYWADTSSNSLISRLIRKASAGIKEQMEELLQGKEIIVNFDEQIVFEQLDQDENAIWSLMLASGYLKAEQVEYRGLLREPWYHLKITNLETTAMFTNLFKSWFNQSRTNYNQFIKALLQNDIDAMNYYMNQISMATFSYFDVDGVEGGKSEPERFYHGFVLGLIAEQTDIYEIRSNRESGFGRYDVMMIPKKRDNCYPAVIIEFKVHNAIKEANLEASVKAARKQIEEKNYDAELFARGFCKEGILHYGFAFEGKKVLIG